MPPVRCSSRVSGKTCRRSPTWRSTRGGRFFLPQRDGLLLAEMMAVAATQGVSSAVALAPLHDWIFALDVYHALSSEAILVNLNGRLPDEGAMVEAGPAWMAGCPVILDKTDSRSLVSGRDNPLVMGLASRPIIDSDAMLVDEIRRLADAIKPRLAR